MGSISSPVLAALITRITKSADNTVTMRRQKSANGCGLSGRNGWLRIPNIWTKAKKFFIHELGAGPGAAALPPRTTMTAMPTMMMKRQQIPGGDEAPASAKLVSRRD